MGLGWGEQHLVAKEISARGRSLAPTPSCPAPFTPLPGTLESFCLCVLVLAHR